MVAASSKAKQQIMSRIDPDILSWPEVAPIVRQVSWSVYDRAHEHFAEMQNGEECLCVCCDAKQSGLSHGVMTHVTTCAGAARPDKAGARAGREGPVAGGCGAAGWPAAPAASRGSRQRQSRCTGTAADAGRCRPRNADAAGEPAAHS